MPATGTYYVYILASGRHSTLYIGITNNLPIRLEQHRAGRGSKFVKQYGVLRLVHVEEFSLERPVPPALTSVVMGPGVRRDDEVRRCRHIADSILPLQ